MDATIKVNLFVSGFPLNGYLNISSLVKPGEDVIQNDLTDLNSVLDHNSVRELLANDVLDYIPLHGKQQVLGNYLCKISHGGKIIIKGIDIREISRLIYLGHIDFIEANKLIYGEASNIYNLKKGLVFPDELINMVLSSNQFRVDSVKFNGIEYICTFIRN